MDVGGLWRTDDQRSRRGFQTLIRCDFYFANRGSQDPANQLVIKGVSRSLADPSGRWSGPKRRRTVLVNAHVYGNTAICAPVLHLRKVSGGSLVTVYFECIERVWEQAKPWNGEDI